MIPAWTYELMLRELGERSEERQKHGRSEARMVGILFARPQSALAQLEIVPNLGYFHRRSGSHIDFFCAGYGAYWEGMKDRFPDQFPVTFDGSPKWLFSPAQFDNFRIDTETKTEWKYQGGCELILLNVSDDTSSGALALDYADSAIVIDLDHAKEVKAIQSVERLFESITRFCSEYHGSNPTWDFSDHMGIKAARSGVAEFFWSFVPKSASTAAKKALPFVVRSIRKASKE